MIISAITASNCTPQTIVIGRRGTYDTMQIAFDLSFLIENYGNGTAVLAVKRSQDESAYPAVVTQEDATLLWTVNETDTAYVGSGECQLMWYVDGGLAKTIIYPMVVMRDILQTAEQPPDGYENWVEHLTELGAETQQNAQNAAQSASDAEQSATDAGAAKDAANEAVLHYPKIENNYWMVWDVASQSYVSTGIQAEGEDGYSPEVTITTITGGHRVTITDKDHPQGQSFDVLDGQGGGGSSDYATLSNKPKINNVELDGNKTAHDLGLAAQSDIPTVPVQSVNGKTGAVNLASGDIAYDESATYQAGSVGAELQEQNRQISDVEENQIPELKSAIKPYVPLDVNGFYINTAYKVIAESPGIYSKILVLPIQHGHKYLFYSTGGNRWRIGLGNDYNIYAGQTCDVQVASSVNFVGVCIIDNTSDNKNYAYIYYYNGSTEPEFDYSLIDLVDIDVSQPTLYPGLWFNNTVRPPESDTMMYVVPVIADTDYILRIEGGNRRNIALSNSPIPVIDESVYMLSSGISTDAFSLRFNSLTYNYLYIYYLSTYNSQLIDFRYELLPANGYSNALEKIYGYTDYHSLSTVANKGIPFVFGSYNVAKYTNDTDIFGTAVYISDNKLHNLKDVIAEINADVLIADEDLGTIDANASKSSHDYVFRPVYPFVTGSAREKIYSKIPFVTTENKATPNGRAVTFATVSVENKTVLIVCVHAKPGITQKDQEKRSQDLTWLLSEVGDYTYDYCLLGGDFNPEAGTSDLTDMETQFANANMIMCNGGRFDYLNTWFDPVGKYSDVIARQMPLDYVITSDNVICNSFKVYADKFYDLYSDHVPIVANLTLLET